MNLKCLVIRDDYTYMIKIDFEAIEQLVRKTNYTGLKLLFYHNFFSFHSLNTFFTMSIPTLLLIFSDVR